MHPRWGLAVECPADTAGEQPVRQWLAPVIGSAFTLAAVVGCAAAAPTPTATTTPTPTLSVIREWDIDGVSVYSSAVTVLLHVYAGIDVWVTLDGERADDVAFVSPTLRSVFYDVGPGQHLIEVRDIVGYSETTSVGVGAPSIPGSL